MSVFSHVMQIGIRSVFIWFFITLLKITASSAAEPKEIPISGSGAGLSQSVIAGFSILQKRDDHIALSLLKIMPYSNVKQKKVLIDAYNAQIQLEKIKKDVAGGNNSSLEKLTPLLEEGSIGYADQYSSSSISTGGSGGGGYYPPGSSDSRSAMDASFASQSQSIPKNFMEIFDDSQAKIGHAAIEEILKAMPEEAADDNPALSFQIRSYRAAMISIMEQMTKRDNVQQDYASVLKIQEDINRIAAGPIDDGKTEQVVDLMKAANLIADKCKKSRTDFGAVRDKMNSSSPAQRRQILNYNFDTVFIPSIAEEFDRVQKIEHVAMSLTCTNAFEALTKTLVEAGVFSQKDCGKIVEYLSLARNLLLKANKDVDLETLSKCRTFYEAQLKEVTTYVGSTFEKIPLTLTLFKHPPAILMLKNDKGAYSDFGRIENDLQYLTLEQKKALFVLLYEVSSHFQELSDWYTRQTFSKSSVQEKDIANLIGILREQIKKPSNPNRFTPGKTDKAKLLEFSITMENLLSGETFKASVVSNFESNRKMLKSLLAGVTHEGITTSAQSAQMHEALDLVTIPDSSFQAPATIADYESRAILVKKMMSVVNTLQNNDALCRRLITASKSSSVPASISTSPSVSPSISSVSLSSMASTSANSSTAAVASSTNPSVALSPSPSPSMVSNSALRASLNTMLAGRTHGGGGAPLTISAIKNANQNGSASVAAGSVAASSPSFTPPLPSPPPTIGVPPTISSPPLSSSAVSSVSSVPSAAEQKAAAQKAAQLQEITDLGAILATKRVILSADVYEETEKNLAEARGLNQAGQIAFASIKLRPIKKALQ